MSASDEPFRSPRSRWFLVAAIALAILVGSVVPLPESAGRSFGPIGLDLWLHAIGFACLAAAIVLAFESGRQPVSRRLPLVTGAVIGYGVAIELLQLAIPYRQFAVIDVAADAIGTVVVVGVWWLRRHWT